MHSTTGGAAGRSRVGVGGVDALPTLGARLRAARLALGAREGGALLSQTDFAERVGDVLGATLHQTRLSRFESDAAVPTVDEALALAVAAGVSVCWLAYGLDVAAVEALTDDELAVLLAQQERALEQKAETGKADDGDVFPPTRGRERMPVRPPAVPGPARGRRR